jgi:hypothetical protein
VCGASPGPPCGGVGGGGRPPPQQLVVASAQSRSSTHCACTADRSNPQRYLISIGLHPIGVLPAKLPQSLCRHRTCSNGTTEDDLNRLVARWVFLLTQQHPVDPCCAGTRVHSNSQPPVHNPINPTLQPPVGKTAAKLWLPHADAAQTFCVDPVQLKSCLGPAHRCSTHCASVPIRGGGWRGWTTIFL